MEGIANDLVTTYGPLGLLAISGWVVSWFLWRALQKERDRFDTINDESNKLIGDCTNIFAVVADRLNRG